MRLFLSKAPGGFTFFNSSLLFLIWRRNWRNCWVPLQEPWVELIFFYFGEGMEMVRGSAALYFLLLWLLFIFWDFWQMCCRSVGIKAGRWEHPDLNIDLTHKAEQIAHWSISPDVFSPGHASRQRCSRLRRLSMCTYDTISISIRPVSSAVTATRAASCPLFDPHVYAWLFIGKRDNGTVTAYPKLLYRDKERKKLCVRPGGLCSCATGNGVRNCKDVGRGEGGVKRNSRKTRRKISISLSVFLR